MTAELRERVTAAVERLREERDRRGGRLPRGRVAQLALSLGIGRSSLDRYIKNGVPPPRARESWGWGEHERALLMELGGDVTAVRDWLVAEKGEEAGIPDVRWMQITKHRDLAVDEIALNEKGTAAAKQCRIVISLECARRNELWLADHKQLDVWVVPKRGSKAVKPWITLFQDANSRKVLGAALSLRPSQAHVLAAMRQAIAEAGVPETLLFDKGLEFTADAIADTATDLVFVAISTRAYHPNHKGKIERLAGTLGRRAVRMLAHRSKQAVDLRKRPRMTIKTPDGESVEGIDLDALIPVVFDAIDEYNARHHKTLKASPNAVYAEDATPERKVAPEALRRLLLKGDTRKITEHGIKFMNNWFYAEELDGQRGKNGPTVEIRYRQDDLTQLEVYRDNATWWCTARLTNPASAAAHEQVLAHRRVRATQSAKTTRKARKSAKRNYEAVVSRAQQMRETTVITSEDAAREIRGAGSRQADVLRDLGLDADSDPDA